MKMLELVRSMWAGAIGGAAILSLMTYFGAAINWIIVSAYVLLILAVGEMLQAALRLFADLKG